MVTFVNENVSAQLIGLQKPTQITDSEQQAHKTPLEKYHNDNYDIPDSGKIELTDKPPTNSSPAVTIPKESVPDEPIEPSCYPLENPYPEDTAPVQRDNAALSLPPRRYRSTHQTKGVVIGTQASTDLREVAWLATVLEAAKFQALRGQLQILPTDLRSYRRSALAEQLLVLLLDYTCLRDCQWQAALLPHLRRAYMDHANICLIQVGVADAQHELRAQRLTDTFLLINVTIH
jgi:magnesium chelatase subunit D